jgi:hypothetical protein
MLGEAIENVIGIKLPQWIKNSFEIKNSSNSKSFANKVEKIKEYILIGDRENAERLAKEALNQIKTEEIDKILKILQGASPPWKVSFRQEWIFSRETVIRLIGLLALLERKDLKLKIYGEGGMFKSEFSFGKLKIVPPVFFDDKYTFEQTKQIRNGKNGKEEVRGAIKSLAEKVILEYIFSLDLQEKEKSQLVNEFEVLGVKLFEELKEREPDIAESIKEKFGEFVPFSVDLKYLGAIIAHFSTHLRGGEIAISNPFIAPKSCIYPLINPSLNIPIKGTLITSVEEARDFIIRFGELRGNIAEKILQDKWFNAYAYDMREKFMEEFLNSQGEWNALNFALKHFTDLDNLIKDYRRRYGRRMLTSVKINFLGQERQIINIPKRKVFLAPSKATEEKKEKAITFPKRKVILFPNKSEEENKKRNQKSAKGKGMDRNRIV